MSLDAGKIVRENDSFFHRPALRACRNACRCPDQPHPDLIDTPEDIVVTGTRSTTPIRVDQSGSSITVLDVQALDQCQTCSVSDILRDVPGIT